MNRAQSAALVALLAGLALLAYGASRGEVRLGLFLFIPFVVGTGAAAALGILLLMAAAFLAFAGLASRAAGRWGGAPPGAYDEPTAPPRETRSRHGGVVLLGPIPIVWGSDRRVLPWMIGAGALLLVLALLVTWAMR